MAGGAKMKELILSVVTPERSIVNQVAVQAIVLPGDVGQLTLLPGHINFITSLRYGTFGYRVGEDWQVAFLSGGFAQVFDGKVTVLAETLDMSHELDLAQAELRLQELNGRLKSLKVGSPEYDEVVGEREHALGKLKAAQKRIH
jgi:F-type H+-transporting ATPase subunit epsilon